MKKKIPLAILPMILMISFVSCGEHHEHTFNSEWSKNELVHWHDSCCGHDVVSERGEHIFNDEGVCTVCSYEHIHTYLESWSYDDNYHWHACDCGHRKISSKSEHTFNSDGVCTTCGYSISLINDEIIANTKVNILNNCVISMSMEYCDPQKDVPGLYLEVKEEMIYSFKTPKNKLNVMSYVLQSEGMTLYKEEFLSAGGTQEDYDNYGSYFQTLYDDLSKNPLMIEVGFEENDDFLTIYGKGIINLEYYEEVDEVSFYKYSLFDDGTFKRHYEFGNIFEISNFGSEIFPMIKKMKGKGTFDKTSKKLVVSAKELINELTIYESANYFIKINSDKLIESVIVEWKENSDSPLLKEEITLKYGEAMVTLPSDFTDVKCEHSQNYYNIYQYGHDLYKAYKCGECYILLNYEKVQLDENGRFEDVDVEEKINFLVGDYILCRIVYNPFTNNFVGLVGTHYRDDKFEESSIEGYKYLKAGNQYLIDYSSSSCIYTSLEDPSLYYAIFPYHDENSKVFFDIIECPNIDSENLTISGGEIIASYVYGESIN